MRKVVTLMTNKWGNEDIIGGRFAGDWYSKFRNKYSRIVSHRSAHVMLVARLKKETHPKACRVFNIWVKQPSKDGRKKFMKKDVLWDGVSGNDPISCDAVKRVKAG